MTTDHWLMIDSMTDMIVEQLEVAVELRRDYMAATKASVNRSMTIASVRTRRVVGVLPAVHRACTRAPACRVCS